MSDQDTEQEQDQREDASQDDEGNDSGETDTSASGVPLDGYESTNAPKEQTQALMEADSPDDVDDSLIEEIEEERKRRLAPENRPDNVEVDNTQRTFNAEKGTFEDDDEGATNSDAGEGPSDDDEPTDIADEPEDDSDDTKSSSGKHRA